MTETTTAPDSIRSLRAKNKALHREVHKLKMDNAYLSRSLAARDGQLAEMQRHARELARELRKASV